MLMWEFYTQYTLFWIDAMDKESKPQNISFACHQRDILQPWKGKKWISIP